MREPDNLFSNKHKNNIRKSLDRKKISIQQSDISIAELREKKRKKENYEKYGLGRLTPEGTTARLKAIPFKIPENLVYEGDKISYHYGYYERGTRLLAILIEKKEFKTGNVQISPEEFAFVLRKIAINDGMDPEIEFASLPDVVKNNAIYAAGFAEGQLLASSTKSRR